MACCRHISILLLFCVESLCVFANIQVFDKIGHLPIDNDEFTKRVIYLSDYSQSGNHIIWDFSECDVETEGFDVSFHCYGDTMINKREQAVRFEYKVSGDTIFDCGYESRSVRLQDSIPKFLMIYPIAYGNFAHRNFRMNGIYSERIKFHLTGESTFIVDGSGMLIFPDADTVKNVLRSVIINKSDVSFDSTSVGIRNNKQLKLIEHIYRWHSNEIRYPLLEVRQTQILSDSTEIMQNIFSSFIPKELRKEYSNCNDKNITTLQESDNKEKNESKSTPEIQSAEISVVGDVLTIDYTLIGNCTEFLIIVSDLNGRVYLCYREHNMTTGNYTKTIDIEGLPLGEYTIGYLLNGMKDPTSKQFIRR